MANQYLQYKDQLAALGCEVKADEPMKTYILALLVNVSNY